ncbi:MAG: beta-galactosidase [Acidobacteriota bacterium]
MTLAEVGGEQAGAAPRFFPVSVWYAGGKARAPMLEPVDATSAARWRRDLEQIKELGFNTVRTWVEWTANEPEPEHYQFRQLELLAQLAHQVGLRFFVQVYADSAPDWVAGRWPDARFVAQDGSVITPQSAPGYCFDHPEVRKKILDFYRQAARVASRFPNLAGWDLWSEPHVINWAIIDFVPNASFCYCPWTQRRFREWLQRKYGSLDNLNRAWYRTFSSWEQVEAPRFGTILSYTDFIDWKLFIRQKLAEDLQARAAAVREIDPEHVVTSHAAVPGLFTTPLMGVGAPDDWLMGEGVDYWGTSVYPKHSFPERHWSRLTLTSLADFIRSSGRRNGGFYVGELQAGMGIRGTVVGEPVTAQDQRLWMLTMLSRGAKGINIYAYYPMSSGYEAGGYGLVQLDGTLTERARQTGALARWIANHGELWLSGEVPQADVAVVYNPLSYLVGGEQHLSRAGAVRESLQGIYRAFWVRNIPVDFVHLQEVEAGNLGAYRIVFLPYPLMLTERAAGALREYVAGGGTLVAEARCGWNDERGFAQEIIPGFGLREVFGAREGRLWMRDEVVLRVEFPGGPSWTLGGTGIAEELLPEPGAEVVGRLGDGTPALIRNRYGGGWAYAVGTFPAMAAGAEKRPENEAFFAYLAAQAGARPTLGRPWPLLDPPVELRVLDTRGGRVLFLFNHRDEVMEWELPAEALEDLETGEPVGVNPIRLRPGEIRVLFAPGGAGSR